MRTCGLARFAGLGSRILEILVHDAGRAMSTVAGNDLKAVLAEKIPEQQASRSHVLDDVWKQLCGPIAWSARYTLACVIGAICSRMLPAPPLPTVFMQDRLKKLRASKGKSELGKVTLEQAIGGMRGIPVGPSVLAYTCLLLWTSLSFAHEPAPAKNICTCTCTCTCEPGYLCEQTGILGLTKVMCPHCALIRVACSAAGIRLCQAAAGCRILFATGT